jgi:chemotaxis methyl-accepting protein methylase
MKPAKLESVQDPGEVNGNNMNSVRRCEANRHFRNKKKEYLKDRINELAANSKNKNIRDLYRGINEFKRGYQPVNNAV